MSCLRYLSVIIIKIYFNKKRIIIIFKFKNYKYNVHY